VRVCPACGSTRCDAAWTCADCGHRPAIVDGYPAFAPELAAENTGFRSEFFAELAALEAESWWFRARNELIAWAATTYAPDCERFLEIGCGTGFVLGRIHEALPAAELWGSEIFSAGLAIAAGRVPSARFLQMDARAIPFRDHFDVIGAFDVLEHIEEDGAVLAAVHDALRPAGVLMLTVPQHPALWSPQDVHAGHVRRYTASGLRRRVEAAGFEIVRSASFVSMLLPMMFASRLRMRRATNDPDFDAIETLRQPRLVNRALAAVMRVEVGPIRHGVSFPAGGSLLVVARKLNPSEAGS
jgi:SAM-dependent methyltransferase